MVVGQYKSKKNAASGKVDLGYLDDPTVPEGSRCPTFAALALFIDNPRWDGVPFMMKAGKAMHKRCAEIRVQFRHVPGNLYAHEIGMDPETLTNELVIRIQPDEGIFLKINNKVPAPSLPSSTGLLGRLLWPGLPVPAGYTGLDRPIFLGLVPA